MEEIEQYFPDLNHLQKKQLERLYPLYTEWNQKINVISRKDMQELYIRHILHSLSIAKFTSFQSGSEILDMGTGGGFPGIPLAIYFPEVSFDLVDSIGKKIKVVKEVSEQIGLTNVRAFHGRAENQNKEYDFAITRAVAPMKTLVKWTHSQISNTSKNSISNGLIALKGGDLKEELKPYEKKVEVVPISKYFSEPFFETKKIVYLPLI